MANVDGKWDCTVDSPMGEQGFTLTVASDGVGGFTGTATGGIGSMDVEGSVDGDELQWSMPVPKPMPITLTCTATVAGDTLDGKVKAGIFGSFPLTGARAG